jgi:hypothetical protein
MCARHTDFVPKMIPFSVVSLLLIAAVIASDVQVLASSNFDSIVNASSAGTYLLELYVKRDVC